MITNLADLIPTCIALAKQAGDVILMEYKKTTAAAVTIKADKTPVTIADLKANQIIETGLKKLTPTIPVLSEESAKISFDERKNWQQYWLVDPLDGTKEFIHHTDEFTVNIAFIDHGHARLGVIYAPC